MKKLAEYINVRNQKKIKQIEQLGKHMDKLKSKLKSDIETVKPKKYLIALAIAVINETYERVGNDDSADNGHFGVTGFRKKHLKFNNNIAIFNYVGKSGVKQEKKIRNPVITKALRTLVEGKSSEDHIFADNSIRVTAKHVNDYLTPFKVTAKDIRGYHANHIMYSELKKIRKLSKLPSDPKERKQIKKKEIKQALESTAKIIGHEPTTLQTHYLLPGFEQDLYK